MFERKGQGSLEYLLLIGGAVLVAAIVIALLISGAGQGAQQAGITSAAALCASTQNLPGVETKTISNTAYYCCSNVVTASNARFKGATTGVLTETAQNAALTTCTLAQ
ncbi:class III signal peptide-containing protein [archaeon]|nr:class III signal peptide-containing protein [archaeon]